MLLRSVLVALALAATTHAATLKALIIDGQNNHNWKKTTPVMKKHLEECGVFTVDVATSPDKKGKMDGFKPDFAAYDVVVSNYNGKDWPKETQAAFIAYMKNGGGLVVIHAADNAFGKWVEWNEMIGLGGWGGRNEKSGPYVYIDKEGKVVRDESKGRGGSHGPQYEFPIDIRVADHPVTKGLPPKFMHAKEELYHQLRGPAKNMTILATAFSAKDKKGTDRHEPVLMAIDYGKGRVFHSVLGHIDTPMRCVGFAVTFTRGCEWAATGKVTQPVPADFPTADKVSMRK